MLVVWSNAQVDALQVFLGADDGAQGCVVGLRPALQGQPVPSPHIAGNLAQKVT